MLQDSDGGTLLRGLLNQNSHASNVARAISLIRSKFNENLIVEEIAKSVGMSISSFHSHFKTVTATTPLQYQKSLRLMEARKLIKFEGESVFSAALKVGYESPNQFSREYARKFGLPPSSEARV